MFTDTLKARPSRFRVYALTCTRFGPDVDRVSMIWRVEAHCSRLHSCGRRGMEPGVSRSWRSR